jgi:hypothetical protein
MIKPIRITHESLDRQEALLLASLERTAKISDVMVYARAKAAAATRLKIIDDQRIELLAGVK